MLDKLIDEPVSLSYLSTVNLVGVISDSLTSDMQGGVDYVIDNCWVGTTWPVNPGQMI